MPRSDDFLLTAEELRLRKQKRRRIVLALGVVLVVAPILYFAARPTRNAVKAWQARRHATKAFALIEQQNWNEAKNESLAAYQLSPGEPQALRAVARLLSRTRQPQALEFWEQLAKIEPLTREDLREEVAIGLVSGETERAATALQALIGAESNETTPRDWLLAAQVRLQQGDVERALTATKKVLEDSKANRREQFQAVLLLGESARGRENAAANQEIERETLQRLSRIAEGQDDVALDCLVLLARRQLASAAQQMKQEKLNSSATEPDPASSPADTVVHDSQAEILPPEMLIERLEHHPLAKAPQKLLAIDLRLQQHPGEKDSLTDEATSRWKNAEASDLVALAMWLNGHGEYQRQLDAIPLERALATRELFLQHVDALGAIGRWDEIKRLLDSERFPLDPVMQRMYLARCNAQLGNEAASKNNWQRALEAAGSEVGKLMSLAEYAEKNGALEIAASAYSQAAGAAPKLRPAWQGKLRATYAGRDTRQIHTILAEMLKLWPNDTAIQNDEAYMRLLLISSGPEADAALPAIERLGEDLVKREPASLPHRTLLALARFKQQKPAAALEVYKDIQASAGALTPSALAVHAAVLNANDHRDDARIEIEKLSSDSLLPEEQALIANLRDL